MDYETSDILGGRLPVAPTGSSMTILRGLAYLAFAAVALFGAWMSLPFYRRFQDQRYRKAMRRRYGIPDTDNRPFNVAYAAATHARKVREAEERKRARGGSAEVKAPVNTATQQRSALADGRITRQRFVQSEGDHAFASSQFDALRPGVMPGEVNGHYPSNNAYFANDVHFKPVAARHDAESVLPPVVDPSKNTSAVSLPSTASTRASQPSAQDARHTTQPTYGKHALEEETDAEYFQEWKKSRVERNELIDGEEEAGWQSSGDEMAEDMEVDEEDIVKPKRGAKRMASHEEDDIERDNGRDKRARKLSRTHVDEVLDEEMADDLEIADVVEIEPISRGKKRDRGEAGSTFGGDEVLDHEEEGPRRRRLKRSVSHKKVDISARGQKRGREAEDLGSEDEGAESPAKRPTRHKRGKRSPEGRESSGGDGMISRDPRCKGRRIGEEWEANGFKFKVGPNGQRLRQALVKRARSLFPMPKDSQHPDRRTNVDVVVETWLSDEEFRAAKERYELAWQEVPTSGTQTPSDYLESPSKAGKGLMWSAAQQKDSLKDSPASRRGPLMQSTASNVGLRGLNQSQITPRRVLSIQPVLAPTPESPTVATSKSYSKWEKQDIEAAAMSKLRYKTHRDTRAPIEEKKAPTPAPLPTIVTPTGASAPAPAGAPSTGPTDKPAQATDRKSPLPFAFGVTSAPAPAKASTANLPSLSIPSAPPKPATSTTPAPTKPGNGFAPPASTFTFAPTPKPAEAQPAAAPTATSNGFLGVPNFFGQKGAPSPTPAPPAPAPGANIFGTASNTTAPSAAPQQPAAPKSTFSFAPSSTTSTAFGTGASAGDQKKAESGEGAAPPAGGSLLSRLGQPPQSATTPAPTTGATNNKPTPLFSFSKPPATSTAPEAPKPAASPAQPANAPAPTSTPKFNFGFSKPTTTTTAPSPAPATDASTAGASSAAAVDASKPAPSTPLFSFKPAASASTSAPSSVPSAVNFGFGAPDSKAQTPAPMFGANAASTTPKETPKATFGFGAGGGAQTSTSAFGGNGASTTPKEEAKPAFGFGASSGTPSPFGGNGQTTTQKEESKSAFGGAGSGTASAFGGNAFGGGTGSGSTSNAFSNTSSGSPAAGSIFGGGAAKGAEGAKSAFGAPSSLGTNSAFGSTAFGNPPAATGSSTTGAPGTKTSAFGSTGFGSTGFGSTGFGFSAFGNPPAATTPATAGQASTAPSAFSNPPSTSTDSQAGETQSKPAFSFFGGAPSSSNTAPFSSNNTASPSPFGSSSAPSATGNATKSPATFGGAQPTPSAFGFGNPSSTSSGAFGSGSSSDTTQK